MKTDGADPNILLVCCLLFSSASGTESLNLLMLYIFSALELMEQS